MQGIVLWLCNSQDMNSVLAVQFSIGQDCIIGVYCKKIFFQRLRSSVLNSHLHIYVVPSFQTTYLLSAIKYLLAVRSNKIEYEMTSKIVETYLILLPRWFYEKRNHLLNNFDSFSMAKNFAESIEVQHNFIFQGERQFHKYWFIFLCSTSESRCHIIHLCSHWHLSRSELKSWNSKFTFL